jgi:hypothetical protein
MADGSWAHRGKAKPLTTKDTKTHRHEDAQRKNAENLFVSTGEGNPIARKSRAIWEIPVVAEIARNREMDVISAGEGACAPQFVLGLD